MEDKTLTRNYMNNPEIAKTLIQMLYQGFSNKVEVLEHLEKNNNIKLKELPKGINSDIIIEDDNEHFHYLQFICVA